MRTRALVALAFLMTAGTASAQVNVVTNGSFETSTVALTGWSSGPNSIGNGLGDCGFNAAAAPGSETVTGTAGFPAAQGSNIALGSTAVTGGFYYDCVLYQDVAIPAGATTATFSGSWGLKSAGGLYAGIYPTTSVPNHFTATLVGTKVVRVPVPFDAALATFTDTFDVSSVAGTTVRLALLISNDTRSAKAVGGFDDIKLLVTTPSADLAVTKTQSTAAPAPGGNIVYTITVTNNGPSDAATVSLSDPLPANTTFVSATGPAGWTVSTPAVGATGTVSATRATLASGSGAQTFTVTVLVGAGTASGTVLSNTATVSTTTTDPTAANNTATATATVTVAVPTMGTWAMMLTALLLMTAGVWSLRRRRPQPVR
jgi:uncharacterized repeat protein (TIGR01451 family)